MMAQLLMEYEEKNIALQDNLWGNGIELLSRKIVHVVIILKTILKDSLILLLIHQEI